MFALARRSASLCAKSVSSTSFKVSATTARDFSADVATFDLTGSFETHRLDMAPNNQVECTKEDFLKFFNLMYTMRRMEITCDNEYKARTIRGFCHLYDGQEAVATGMNAVLNIDDSWITSYRCHCTALARGGSVEGILAELFGFQAGMTKGKGGSMHFYNKAHNFYGGQGIVGAQVPVGTGLAFANKYNTKPGEKMPIAVACYGDGAANQGQIWESANMSALWKLPMVFCIENNHYGMGTSIDRHSSHSDYFKMGNHIPGLRIDGMNVLAVREGFRFVKDYVSAGNGPMYVEMMTYRYHGHSMSDPGTTYRNREEIALTRSTRDPLEFVKRTMIDAGFVDSEEIKNMEKAIRKDVQKAVMIAKESSPPGPEQLWTYLYAKDHKKESQETPDFIRAPFYQNSFGRVL
jgi:pyruvate dehydrogenase E1 component alpha subunit